MIFCMESKQQTGIRSRRRFLRDSAVGMGAAALVSCGGGPAPVKPNILFLPVDDLKPLLTCFGAAGVLTPNIDRLAQRGMVFRNNMCQQAVCGPSRASLLTGSRPDTTKVWDLKTRMRDINPGILSLPQHFKSQGYTAVGMGKVFDGRCCDGWDTQDVPSWSKPFVPTGGRLYVNPDYSTQRVDPEHRDRLSRPSTECEDVADDAYADGLIANAALREMRELAAAGRPFFLAPGFKKPHLPFTAPKRYWDMYDREQFRLPELRSAPEGSPLFAYQDSWELRNGYTDVPLKGPIPEEKQITLLHGYYATVTYVDAQIGKVLDELEALGVADNTIVALWGDHGWHLGDHGMWCKHTNYEQAARSPLLIAAPGMAGAGQGTDSPTEFADIFPTLCELAGLPAPEQLEGVSLVPLLNKTASDVKAAAISQYPRSTNGKQAMGYAYRSRRYRYVEWVEKDFYGGQTTGTVIARELYDYQKAPHEPANLIDSAEYAAVVQAFEKMASGGWEAFQNADGSALS